MFFYIDHHRTGDIPQSNKLTTLVNTDANTCTSLLVNDFLKGQYIYWAIAGAFGDNMDASAQALCLKTDITEQQQSELKELGIYLNYNGYGASIADLHFHPADFISSLTEVPRSFYLD